MSDSTMLWKVDPNSRSFATDVLGDKVLGAQTSSEALHRAGLADWNVRKLPLFAYENVAVEAHADEQTRAEQRTQIGGKFAVVRDCPGETIETMGLGVVGSRYSIVQNEQTFGLLDDVLDARGRELQYEVAGSMYGGRKVFVGLKLPDTMLVGGVDPIEMRLLAVNTHDGTSPFTLSLHIGRLPCTNAIELTRRNAKAARQHWSLRHTSSIDGRVVQARETLKLTFAAVDEFEREAEQLIAKSITDRQFERLIENVFPTPKTGASEKAKTAVRATRDSVRRIYRESPTQESIRGTAWGALNAFVEHADWQRDVRPGKQDAAEARALAQLDSRHVARFKSNVMDRVLAMQ